MINNRVALITTIISPYRIPVFNVIARKLEREFKVFFFSEMGKHRSWKIQYEKIKFTYEVLQGFCFGKNKDFPVFFNPLIFKKLKGFNPDVVIIGGYNHPSSILTLFYSRIFGKRLILWCESNKYDSRLYSKWRESYKKWFIRNCTEFIVPGTASFEYLISYGVFPDKIWIAPNAVDNEFFTEECDEVIKNVKDFKRKKGYPERIILYVGRLVDKKGIMDLLKAYSLLTNNKEGIGLVLVGKGKDENKYRRFCKNEKLRSVFFEGFVPQKKIPLYYAVADIFVLPTYSDTWGLVLNEAMACKLPIISTSVAGASYDLVYNGKNGYTYSKGNIKGLFDMLKKMFNEDRIKMGKESFNIIQNFSPEKCALGFIKAIEKT